VRAMRFGTKSYSELEMSTEILNADEEKERCDHLAAQISPHAEEARAETRLRRQQSNARFVQRASSAHLAEMEISFLTAFRCITARSTLARDYCFKFRKGA
jgi:hypothetical protein